MIAAAEKAGLPLFLGSYPITPATDILHELSKHKSFPPKAQNRHGEYRHGSRSSAFFHDRETAMEVRERKARHRKQYQNQRRVKPGKLQFDRMEADGSLKKENPGESPKTPQDEGKTEFDRNIVEHHATVERFGDMFGAYHMSRT